MKDKVLFGCIDHSPRKRSYQSTEEPSDSFAKKQKLTPLDLKDENWENSGNSLSPQMRKSLGSLHNGRSSIKNTHSSCWMF